MMLRRLSLSLVGLLLAAPASAQLRPVAATTLRTTDTSANSLVVGGASGATTGTGGIKAGQVSVNGVGIIGTDGRLPAINSTYFASTAIAETLITDGALLARVADNETISGAWTFSGTPTITNATTTFTSANPILKLIETGATANEGHWRLIADGDALTLQSLNDAESSSANLFSATRTGHTIDTTSFGATQILLPGCSGLGCASAPSIASATATTTGLYMGATGGFGVVNAGTTVFAVASGASGATSTGALAATVVSGGSVAVTATSISGAAGLFDRSGGDGTIIDLRASGASQGTISIAGATTAYNTFMGAHYTQLQPGQEAPEVGTVVVSSGRTIPVKPRRLTKAQALVDGEALSDAGPAPILAGAERFVYVEPSTRRNQKGVYGIWHADLGQTAAGMSWGDPDAEVYQVAGVGLGPGVWVTDTCGPIRNGDWLATSPVEGLAERQCTVGAGGKPGYDPVARDYTLGKALTDVDFSTVAPDADGVRKVLIPLVIVSG